jgi:hypothetical protein
MELLASQHVILVGLKSNQIHWSIKKIIIVTIFLKYLLLKNILK